MPYATDDPAWDHMVNIAAAVENKLAECQLPGVCQSTPVPGQAAVLDRCGQCTGGDCGGQAWTRLVNEFPSDAFPTPSSDPNCDAPMAFVIEVGIARCLHVGKTSQINGYIPPSVADSVADTSLQMADKRAVRRAIKEYLNRTDKTYILGAYQTIQAAGDCGGGVWQVTIWEG